MAGRPPSEKSFANMLRIAISEAKEGGGSKLRAVADALVDKAMTGDVPAIREIADRLDGKVAQPVTGRDGGPIEYANLTEEQIDARLAAILGEAGKPPDPGET
jgi:hypothetical protein